MVEISALPQADGVDIAATLKAVAVALAEALGEPPHGTWATWSELDSRAYAEGGHAPLRQPRDTHPPLVRLIAFEGRSAEQVEAMLTCVADVLVRELRLEPGNVFVRYEEAQPGRLYQGGAVATRRES